MKRVVFVDDSKTVLMSVEIALEDLIKEGILELKTFENPLELLEAVENGFVYDLLVTDINMPQLSGLEMAKRLKSTPSVKLKPIIALTTEKSPQIVQKGKQIGLAGWLVKPFTPDKVVMAIKRVLRIR
jgi:two-component system chemotaxis response regulator CheY